MSDGLWLEKRGGVVRVRNDYSKNQFKHMPSNEEMDLFKVRGSSVDFLVLLIAR